MMIINKILSSILVSLMFMGLIISEGGIIDYDDDK